eukprot:scaffold1543_cov162-Pinguiococcus_pyrenoidosus.AAC.3
MSEVELDPSEPLLGPEDDFEVLPFPSFAFSTRLTSSHQAQARSTGEKEATVEPAEVETAHDRSELWPKVKRLLRLFGRANAAFRRRRAAFRREESVYSVIDGDYWLGTTGRAERRLRISEAEGSQLVLAGI